MFEIQIHPSFVTVILRNSNYTLVKMNAAVMQISNINSDLLPANVIQYSKLYIFSSAIALDILQICLHDTMFSIS
jgi:hypothetical protein